MRILFITRHFNRCGYYVLRHFLEEGRDVVGVVLKRGFSPLRHPLTRLAALALYRAKCCYYGCDSCKFQLSEEILAKSRGVKVIKIDSIKKESFQNILNSTNPDIIVLGGGWPERLPPRVFSYPPLGTLSAHPSLLPLFRGTSVHRWQIFKGVSESGVAIHYVDDDFDTGAILARQSVPVMLDDTPQSLFDKIARISGPLLSKVLDKISLLPNSETRLPSRTQSGNSAHYFEKWKWDDDFLDISWDKPFLDIYNLVRAANQESYQYKGPIFRLKGRSFFLRRAFIHPKTDPPDSKDQPSGSVCISSIDDGGVHLQRPGEHHQFIIHKIQIYDRWYPIRRSFHAKYLKKLSGISPGDQFL